MRWLLITNTENRNPGDEWIRIGVQRLVRDIDKSPVFILRNKEFVEDQASEVDFDKAIWCGSPLFWSHEYQGCWENHWWNAWINGWLFKERSKVLILGVGSALGKAPHDKTKYFDAIETVRQKCWKLVTRQKVVPDDRIPVSCCPSVFALAGDTTVKTLRLCNLMPDGAHDSFLNEEESSVWRKIAPAVSETLKSMGFELVCHAQFEDVFAETLGWPKAKIHFKPETAEDYLPLYAKAQCYVGNRMHGAMLAIGAGSPAMAIGYDSRLGMVSYAGGRTVIPSNLSVSAIRDWMDDEPKTSYAWEPEYAKQLEIINEFSKA